MNINDPRQICRTLRIAHGRQTALMLDRNSPAALSKQPAPQERQPTRSPRSAGAPEAVRRRRAATAGGENQCVESRRCCPAFPSKGAASGLLPSGRARTCPSGPFPPPPTLLTRDALDQVPKLIDLAFDHRVGSVAWVQMGDEVRMSTAVAQSIRPWRGGRGPTATKIRLFGG